MSYAALAENVARCGNALRALDIPRGGRLVMAVLDGPVFFYLFWGAIKAGIVPVPVNTLLRAADYAVLIDDSACAGIVYAPQLAREIEPALAAASHRPPVVLRTEGEGHTLPTLMRAAAATLDPAPAGPWMIVIGFIRPARPAGRRARCMPTATWRWPASAMGWRPSASAAMMCSFRPRSCSSPTVSAMRWRSRSGSAAPPC